MTEESTIRSKAVTRSWICPGAGFALLGRTAWACAVYLISLVAVPMIAWFALHPNATSLWAAVSALVFASGVWVVEQMFIKKSTITVSNPPDRLAGFVSATCLLWGAAIAATALLVTAVGSLRMAGPGMSPTLNDGERLMYHKHLDRKSVKTGAIIVYRNAADSNWGDPGWLVVSRILAEPGDSLSIQDFRYVVNGDVGPEVASTGDFDVAIEIPKTPKTVEVPENCYFVVQDTPSASIDSRVLSWVRRKDIVGSRLWYVGSRGFFYAD